jgi:hypothetical protein
MKKPITAPGYSIYQYLATIGTPTKWPNGALMMAIDPSKPLWRVRAGELVDRCFDTLAEARAFCKEYKIEVSLENYEEKSYF